MVFTKGKLAKVFGVIGCDGGYTAKFADASCLITVVNPVGTNPHAEAFHAVVWHALGSHPKMKMSETKWESVH